MSNPHFTKSDIGAQAAWKGFSSQTLYIAYRLLADEDGYEYYPEDIEDLVIKKDGSVVEAVQVKNISSDLTLSSLASTKTSRGGEGFFNRMCSLHTIDKSFSGIKIVYFGRLGAEFQEVANDNKEVKMILATAARGQSKKLQLMNIINDCMRDASNREEFIALMESEGYKVRWEASRRNITYTAPSGWQCRDRLLFGDKYLKENMEYEFRIRAEIIHGRAVGEEPARADGTDHAAASSTGADTASRSASHESGVGGSAERPLHAGVSHRETDCLSEGNQRTAGTVPDQDADGGAAESVEASGADERTGWEAEREAFFSAQHQSAQTTTAAPGWAYMGSVADGNGNVAFAVVGLGYRLEQSQSVAPVMDSTTMHPHTDRKTLRKKQQKKIAQGHAKDDCEEDQTWQQTM